jgi:hypothetical protein
MNAGMYGLPDGKALQGRILAAQLGRQAAAGSLHNAAGTTGAAVTSVPVTAGVRTPILGITGRGAIRYMSAHNNTGTSTSIQIEVVIDGVLVIDRTRSPASATGDGVIAVGMFNSTSSQATWDYIPFDSSVQVFVTLSAHTTCGFAHVTDIHQ